MMGDYSSDDNFYGDDGDDDEGVTDIELRPCGNCGRNFNVDVLPRHHNICTKLKQRKAFDSKQQRLAEIEKIPVTAPPPRKNIVKPKKKDWRWEHEQFIRNIRAARGTSKGAPPAAAPPAVNPDYVQCPHCERRFNETAAERHIDFCKEQKSRIPKQSDAKYAAKKEKQEKRATYKPPLPGQKKKSTGNNPTIGRTNSNSAPSNQRTKQKPHQPSNKSFVEREIKSDTTLGGRRKKMSQQVQNGEQVDNVRYGKTSSASSRTSSSEHDCIDRSSRSGRTKGEPKWFEDLKRNESASQLHRNLKDDLESSDSGVDLMNENYTRTNSTKGIKDSPVGVVRPTSRHNVLSPEKPERTPGCGRRKMANFCHDCGTRYPVPEAKFCCECGVRRMALT